MRARRRQRVRLSRPGYSARRRAAHSAEAPDSMRRQRVSAMSRLPDSFICLRQTAQLIDIKRLDTVADMEKEDAKNNGGDEHIEGHTQFNHHGHAVSGHGGRG